MSTDPELETAENVRRLLRQRLLQQLKEAQVHIDDSDAEPSLLRKIGVTSAAVMIHLTLVVPAAILQAWVASILWLWFLVPLGVPAISTALALGVGLAIRTLLDQRRTSIREEGGFGIFLVHLYVAPFIALFLGYLVTLFL